MTVIIDLFFPFAVKLNSTAQISHKKHFRLNASALLCTGNACSCLRDRQRRNRPRNEITHVSCDYVCAFLFVTSAYRKFVLFLFTLPSRLPVYQWVRPSYANVYGRHLPDPKLTNIPQCDWKLGRRLGCLLVLWVCVFRDYTPIHLRTCMYLCVGAFPNFVCPYIKTANINISRKSE